MGSHLEPTIKTQDRLGLPFPSQPVIQKTRKLWELLDRFRLQRHSIVGGRIRGWGLDDSWVILMHIVMLKQGIDTSCSNNIEGGVSNQVSNCDVVSILDCVGTHSQQSRVDIVRKMLIKFLLETLGLRGSQ